MEVIKMKTVNCRGWRLQTCITSKLDLKNMNLLTEDYMIMRIKDFILILKYNPI